MRDDSLSILRVCSTMTRFQLKPAIEELRVGRKKNLVAIE